MTPEVVTPIDMSFRLWYVVIIGPKGNLSLLSRHAPPLILFLFLPLPLSPL